MSEALLTWAGDRARMLGATLVVASTTGRSAERALERFGGLGIPFCVVSHDRRRGRHFDARVAARLKALGIPLLEKRARVPLPLGILRMLGWIERRRFRHPGGVSVGIALAVFRAARRAGALGPGGLAVVLSGKRLGLSLGAVVRCGLPGESDRIDEIFCGPVSNPIQ